MKKIFILITACCLLQNIHAQINNQPDTAKKEISLEEVIISATNFSEKKKNIAQKTDVISAKTIALTNAQNTGDLLINTGKIFVQKSQQGGSSPVIRGFEASRILLVIDGVRMNNAIYRSGHLQNIITTDQNMLSRVEVMYGPSSAIYGSDALGGAIHFITKGPELSSNKKDLVTGSGFARYSSANTEKTVHADASIGGRKFAWFQSYNYSDFGDMKMGNQYPDKYPDFGRRIKYIDEINSVDSIITNTDDRVQKFSGYRQWDITQKFLYKQNNKVAHLLNLQLSNTNNVPRYDRLQDIRNGNLRYAEWYYGPQKRLLGAYELNISNIGFVDELKANISYQDIKESRQTREYRRYDRFDSRVEKVKVWGVVVSGRKVIGNNEITGGVDMQLNDVKSVASRTNQTTGEVIKWDTRYPDGKNKMNSFALFVQHVYKFSNQKLVLNDGIRLQAIHLKSSIVDNSFFNLPQTDIKQNNVAVTGNIGLVYSAGKSTVIKTNLSSGFRAPNIDDLAKVFESSTAAKQVVLPNTDLKPEYTYNADISVSQKIANRITVEVTGFYTWFRNAIVKAPFRLNGQDSIIYNGVISQVLASQNVNKANLYGVTAGVTADINNKLSFTSTLSFTKGEYLVDVSKASAIYEKQTDGTYSIVQRNVSKRPLDHIPPVTGRTGIIFKTNLINTEVYFLYNGWKRLENYNSDGEDNAQYATADGMPAWITANWRAAITVYKNTQVQLGVENIFDRNYRYFASGFSAPGRNFIIALRANF
jgi:hemoglobin/transferrin/lactoferrin receptor protein